MGAVVRAASLVARVRDRGLVRLMALFESSTDAINIPPPARASRVRTAVDRWLARCVPAPRPRIAPTPSAPRALRDLRDAWFVAELECALALRAWQLAIFGRAASSSALNHATSSTNSTPEAVTTLKSSSTAAGAPAGTGHGGPAAPG